MSVKPRTAGILGMVVGMSVCVGGGALIARPTVWFLGVVVLVGGTILFSVAATWVVRSSWAPDDWPDASIPEEKRRRRQRRILVVQCVLAVILIGLSVGQILIGAAQGWVSLILGFSMLAMATSTLRALAKQGRANPPTGV